MSRNGFNDCEREYNKREEAVEMAREERRWSMSESNSEFLARMNALVASAASPLAGPSRDNMWTLWLELPRLIALAEERVMIGEHQMDLLSPYAGWSNWQVSALDNITVEDTDLSTAIRAVVTKIKEGKSQAKMFPA